MSKDHTHQPPVRRAAAHDTDLTEDIVEEKPPEPREYAPEITTAAAQEMPDGAKQFLMTPAAGPLCKVTAIDETDAIQAWCHGNAIAAEKREVKVSKVGPTPMMAAGPFKDKTTPPKDPAPAPTPKP